MIDRTFQHQDSHGGGGRITDGDTQWMTVQRSEFERKGRDPDGRCVPAAYSFCAQR